MNDVRGTTPATRMRCRWRTGCLRSPLFLIALTTMVLGHDASAETARVVRARDLKDLSLDQLFSIQVTTVSQKPESLSTTAAAIHVVTQDVLRRMGVNSLPEALRNVPGIEVARVDSRQYAITARGFNGTTANKLLVLIDGRSVYTPLFSGVFWDAQNTRIEDIEQIEVIRGPGATVWGANAVNGVINVVTKKASQTQGASVVGGGGEREHASGNARYGGRLGSRAFFRVYGKTFDSGASVRPNGLDAGDRFGMTQGGFRIDWDPTATDALSIQGDLYGGSAQQPTASEIELAGGNTLAHWMRRVSSTAEIQLRAYYDRTERDIPLTFGQVLDTYDIEARHHFAFANRHHIVWGAGYRLGRDDVDNSAGLAFLPARVSREVFSFFLQDEVAMSDNRLRVSLGSKFEHNEYTGFEYQPSIRVAWTPLASHTLWTAVSRAVRTPSRIDREFFVPAAPPYLLVGGPGFESEILRALEVGYKGQPHTNVIGSVATFYNIYDNLRSLETSSPQTLANGLEGRSYGVEAEMSYQMTGWCSLNAGYTALRLELDPKPTSTDVTQQRQVGDSPRVQVVAGSAVTLPYDLSLDLRVRHVGELPNQQVPEYTTADAHVGWRSRYVEIGLTGRDLLAPRHPEFGPPATRREVPRSFHGQIQCRF